MHQSGPSTETEQSTVEASLQRSRNKDTPGSGTQLLVKNANVGRGKQEITWTVESADLPINQVPKLSATQPCKSQ